MKMNIKNAFVFVCCLLLIAVCRQVSFASLSIDSEKLKLYGDFRFRVEKDWDSKKSDGTKRTDRDRLRIRFRMGLTYLLNENILFGARLRTGNPLSQQSPHVTLGDKSEPKKMSVDKIFVQKTWDAGWFWAGKNSFPFWTQNELFWDDDVTPEGIACGLTLSQHKDGKKQLKFNSGYFVLDASENSNEFSAQSRLVAGQLTYQVKSKKAGVVSAAGFYAFKNNASASDPVLEDLDYNIWVLGTKVSLTKNDVPLTLGLDWMRNAKNYPAGLFNGDEKTGFAFSLKYGALQNKKDWQAGYTYAHIEKYGVVARFAQDDWVRWGTATETTSSNFKGHEFSFAYAPANTWNLLARFYFITGIKPNTATSASLEDGNRFRLDFNFAF